MLARFGVALIVIGACTPNPPAVVSERACLAYHHKLASLIGKHAAKGQGVNPLLGGYCVRRGVTKDYVACIQGAETLDMAERCRPRIDPRPVDARPDDAMCTALVDHVDALVQFVVSTPPRPGASRIAMLECRRWETVAHVRCQLDATTLEALDRCGL